MVFRNNLRMLFQDHDKDKSGELSVKELKALLSSNLKDIEKRVKLQGGEDWRNFDKLVEDYAFDIMNDMKRNKRKDTVSWEEFKIYYYECADKQKLLENFIRNTFI